jgi:hypothetical protein
MLSRWKAPTASFEYGIEGGPLVLFDQEDNVLIISPLNEFMAASMWHNQDVDTVSWGIMGGVTSVPDNYMLKTIVYYGGKGINQVTMTTGHIHMYSCIRFIAPWTTAKLT